MDAAIICRWCGSRQHRIENCPDVRAAFDPAVGRHCVRCHAPVKSVSKSSKIYCADCRSKAEKERWQKRNQVLREQTKQKQLGLIARSEKRVTKAPAFKPIVCARCGKTIQHPGSGSQKRCKPCAVKSHNERQIANKRAWREMRKQEIADEIVE